MAPPSLLILGIGSALENSRERLSKDLNLHYFQKRRLVNQVNCLVLSDVISDVDEFESTVDDALQCAVRISEFRTKTTSKQLSAFVEHGLSELFFQFFHQYCLNCKTLEFSSPDPTDVVCFYNNAVQEIGNVLTLSSFNVNDDIDDNDEKESNETFEEKLEYMNELVMKLKLPMLPVTVKDCFMTSYQCCLQYIDQLEHKDTPQLLNRINTLLQDQNAGKTDTDAFVFPWSDVLELLIIKHLNLMYVENGARRYTYQTMVHYSIDVWSKIMVENPLKEYTKKFNSTLRTLNDSESPSNYKRRKFSKEVRLRNTIEATNDELSLIEESLRKRKSRRRSRDEYSPIGDLVNQSTILCQDIKNEKLEMSHRLLLKSNLNPNAKVFYPRKRSMTDGGLTIKKKLTNDELPSSLEDSVIDCFKSIDDTSSALRRSQDYWKRLLNG